MQPTTALNRTRTVIAFVVCNNVDTFHEVALPQATSENDADWNMQHLLPVSLLKHWNRPYALIKSEKYRSPGSKCRTNEKTDKVVDSVTTLRFNLSWAKHATVQCNKLSKAIRLWSSRRERNQNPCWHSMGSDITFIRKAIRKAN